MFLLSILFSKLSTFLFLLYFFFLLVANAGKKARKRNKKGDCPQKSLLTIRLSEDCPLTEGQCQDDGDCPGKKKCCGKFKSFIILFSID